MKREKPLDCKWGNSCDCDSAKNLRCENCTFYKMIDSGYGWCKALPEPIVVAWCKDICASFKNNTFRRYKINVKFIAWYCHKCRMYFREIELHGDRCPECNGVVVPQPMETKE